MFLKRKRWFSIELEMCEPGPRDGTRMEDVSARMRAVRQLELMVRVASKVSLAECPENNVHFDSRDEALSICGSRKIWTIAETDERE